MELLALWNELELAVSLVLLRLSDGRMPAVAVLATTSPLVKGVDNYYRTCQMLVHIFIEELFGG